MMRVYNIGASKAFMPCFVEALLSGDIDIGLNRNFATSLADLTLYLPTKRAEEALLDCLDEVLPNGYLAPEIITLGGMDAPQDTAILSGYQFDGQKLATPMGNTQRLIYLTRLVHAFLSQQTQNEVLEPSMSEAVVMAQQLAQLLDAFEYEQVPLSRLVDVVPEQFALNWAQTLQFLNLIFEHWPNIKQSTGTVDRAEWDNENLRLATHYWASEKSHHRAVIALGSTGSRPATAQLLKAIGAHPSGALILPGLDQDMDEASFFQLSIEPEELAPSSQHIVPQALQQAHAHAHPQYRLAQLLKTLNISRDDVEELAADADEALNIRSALLSEAMAPIEQTVDWANKRSELDLEAVQKAFEHVTIVEASKDATQAQAIAVILRQSLEQHKSTALVTPDRMLARRVAAELKIWDIDIDDSAGVPLSEVSGARLIGLLIALWQSEWGKSDLVALLSHPDVVLDFSRSQIGRFLRHIHLSTLRQMLNKASPSPLRSALGAEELDAEMLAEFNTICASLEALCLPVETQELALSEWANLVLGAYEKLRGENPSNHPGDEELVVLLHELMMADGADIAVRLDQLGVVMMQTMATINVRKPYKAAHNIAILGPLEARLQHFDRLILAGLSENIWPRPTQTSAWASRGMLAQIGREPPERVIGLSAHDFATSFGAKELFITRSENDGAQPSLPSRWLQRLDAFLGEQIYGGLVKKGAQYLTLAQQLSAHQAHQDGFEAKLAPRPMPSPPVAARPKHLSITQIKPLRQDPYAVYAQEVLQLTPLDPLDAPLDAAMSGIIVHELMAQLAATDIFARTPDEQAEMIAEALLSQFEKNELPQHMQLLWAQWLKNQLVAYFDWERQRRPDIKARYAEIKGKWWFKGALEGLSLRGRADRLDVDAQEGVHILDFKTGQAPNPSSVLRFDEPQLLLEALMVREGAFEDLGRRAPTQMAYVPLKLGPKITPVRAVLSDGDDIDKVLDQLNIQLQSLIEAFCLNPNMAFVSHLIPTAASPSYEPPYDHLARVKEWRRHQGMVS